MQGTLKGYDQLLNLVMDETIEYLRGVLARAWSRNRLQTHCSVGTDDCVAADPEDPLRITDQTRNLGLVVSQSPLASSMALKCTWLAAAPVLLHNTTLHCEIYAEVTTVDASSEQKDLCHRFVEGQQ